MGEEWLRWSRFSGGEAASPLLLLPWSFIELRKGMVHEDSWGYYFDLFEISLNATSSLESSNPVAP